jgi:hypothetical protein
MVDTKELSIGYMLTFLGMYLLSVFSYVYIGITNKNVNAPKYIVEIIDFVNQLGWNGPTIQLAVAALLCLSAAIIIGGLTRSFGAF